MNIQNVNIKEVKSNPNNPRLIKDDKFKKLVKSIKDFPQMLQLRPIVVNDDMVVLGGNMRLKACKEAGLKEVPIIKASELTPEQEKEFIIKDNVGFGEWDWNMLANEWESEQLDEWGLDIPEYENPIELEAEEDDFEVNDEIETDIVLGDLFEIGKHRLICGSATDSNVWEKLKIEDNTCCFTSPPYNVGNSAKLTGNKTISAKGNFYDSYNDDSANYDELLQESLSNAITYTDGVCFNVQLLANNKIKLLEWVTKNKESFVDIITWDKEHSAPAMAEGVFSSQFEWLVIFNKLNNSRHIPLSSWRGTISNVYTAPPQRNNEFSKIHGATFPVHLPTFIIQKVMDKCNGVVDCFCGTGTTMVVAHQLNRKSYGIELDPKYCQVIIDRMLKLDPSLQIKKNGQLLNKS